MRTENTPYLTASEFQQTVEPRARVVALPTVEQEARRAQRRRFNRLVVTLPVVLVTVAWLVLILTMIWLSIAGSWFAIDTDQERYRALLSGIADIVTILLLTPMLLLCAVPIIGAIAFTVYRRRKKAEAIAAGPSLPLFWRIENIVASVRDSVARTTPKIARPVINAHAMAAFIRRFIFELKQLFTQERIRNDRDR